MAKNFIESEIRQVNSNLLIVNVALVLGILSLAYANDRYLYNFVAGPFKADYDFLISVNSAEEPERYFVEVTGDAITESRMQEVTVRKRKHTGTISSEVTADYVILLIKDRRLLVKAPHGDHLNLSFSGSFGFIFSPLC